MSAVKLLHTADIHLRGTGDERWEALEVVLAVASEHGVDAVVVSGDMFDRGVEAQRLKTPLRDVFERHPTPVVILPGNHDEKGLSAGDFFGEEVVVLDENGQFVDIGTTRIIGVPFADIDGETVYARLLEAGTKTREGATNVLLYHGELLDMIPGAGAFGDEDDSSYMPVRLSAFAGLGFDYVLAGHFHRGFDVRRYEGGFFVYPGSPVSITRAEVGRRCVCLVVPGQAPIALEIDTAHAERVAVELRPFDPGSPIDEIETRLSGLHPRAAAYVSVDGYVDLGKLGMGESEFDAALKEIERRPGVVEVSARWRDVGEILRHELFTRFHHRLEQSDLSPQRREAASNLVIEAFADLTHED